MEVDLEVIKIVGIGLGSLASIFVIKPITKIFIWVKGRIENEVEDKRSEQAFRDHVKNANELQDLKMNKVMADLTKIQMLTEANFEISPTAFFICDGQGHCTEVNDSMLKLFRATQDEMRGLGWHTFIHPQDRDRARKTWVDAIQERSIKLRDSFRVIDKGKLLQGKIEVIEEVSYKTIFKFDEHSSNLEIGVSTVWVIGNKETTDEMLRCIMDFIKSANGTPTLEKLKSEIQNKK